MSTINNIIATQNAAMTDLISLPDLWPQNEVIVYGTPGLDVLAYTGAGTYIYDGKFTDQTEKKMTISDKGQVSFFVFQNFNDKHHPDAHNKNIASVSVRPDDGSSVMGKDTVVAFSEYQTSQNPEATKTFLAYNYTTGAPADGEAFNAVYLKVSPEVMTQGVKKISISVDNNATLVGYSGTDKVLIPLSSSGCATIQITNKKTGVVNVTLDSPESPWTDNIAFRVNFVKF